MSQGFTPEDELVAQKQTEEVAKELSRGVKRDQIIKQLVTRGWHGSDAVELVTRVEREIAEYKQSAEGRQVLAAAYKKHMIYGVLWFAGGTVVTVFTFATSKPGGSYWVAWGAMLFGLIDFFRGWIGWRKHRG